ncbi:hypothetical protein EIP86_002799 [Pleurotus ostreatoroseus]|nr:hypothetical protein EIP86_002799 [Pleurotus ostreatoroseus]
MAIKSKEDEEVLAGLGYKQEFKRGFTPLEVFGIGFRELSSTAPTSGGLYYWTFKYASPKWRNLLSWIVGYSNTMGNVSGAASITWGCAVQLMAAVSIGSNLTFTPTTGQI